MSAKEIEATATACYWQVFNELDGEPHLTGMEAAKIATEVQQLIERRLTEVTQ